MPEDPPPAGRAQTSLYYYRARYYDPQAGRFLREDPVDFRGGVNFYQYVRNNPLNLFDPSGLAPMPQDPHLPTVPTGKAGCAFVGETHSGGKCKTRMYKCRAYGAIVTFPQAVSKACPSINPVTGLVNTGEIDPNCRPEEPTPRCRRISVPDPTQFVVYVLIFTILGLLSRVPAL